MSKLTITLDADTVRHFRPFAVALLDACESQIPDYLASDVVARALSIGDADFAAEVLNIVRAEAVLRCPGTDPKAGRLVVGAITKDGRLYGDIDLAAAAEREGGNRSFFSGIQNLVQIPHVPQPSDAPRLVDAFVEICSYTDTENPRSWEFRLLRLCLGLD